MSKIGIFGGSFDPVHYGHLQMIESALTNAGLDKVVVMPSRISPHKINSQISPEHRINMLKLATSGMKNVEISEMEIQREGRSYTCDTVCQFAKIHPKDELYLIMGEDMFLTLDKWYMADVFLKKVGVIYFSRGNGAPLQIKDKFAKELEIKYNTSVVRLNERIKNISSTQLRIIFATKQKETELLPQNIVTYICENRLYSGGIFSSYVEWFEKNQTPEVLSHCIGVMNTSMQMAQNEGVDVKKAAAAGLLHDLTKRYLEQKQYEILEKYGAQADPECADDWVLLHGFTAALIAENDPYFAIKDAVILDAIRYHTVGYPVMSKLAKIVFLADVIEPSRTFAGVDELRSEYADHGLDSAFDKCVISTIENVIAKGKKPHRFQIALYSNIHNES